MIENLRKKRKTIWQIFIVLMMVLMVVFLAAPASAKTCKPTYTKYHKVIELPVDYDTYDKQVFSYNIPTIPKTVVVWVTYTRSITSWHQERLKFLKEYCTVNKECEKIGEETQVRPTRTSFGRWKPTDVYCVTT